MQEKNTEPTRGGDEPASSRRFKYAVYSYAVIELAAILILIYYKVSR